MKLSLNHISLFLFLAISCSCRVVEKSSRHGFESGIYKIKNGKGIAEMAYVEVTDTAVEVYPTHGLRPGKRSMFIPLNGEDSSCDVSVRFIKKSLDIDFTTIPLKYRPSVQGLPPQLNVDFNAALYVGWRHDAYIMKSHRDPLGRCRNKITNRGYDFGVFAGPATSDISSFSTLNRVPAEYNGFILQFGIAAFVESNVASFGIAIGYDHLFGPDRKVWVYDGKPWIGFIVGFPLN